MKVDKLIKAIKIQYDRPIPELPVDWTGEEQWGYIHGWEDAMEHIWEAIETYDYEDELERLMKLESAVQQSFIKHHNKYEKDIEADQ